MPFADIATGARLHYEHLNAGTDGLPVIVVHGLLGTGRKDLGAVLDWLADEGGYEVIAPTLRGYGESTPQPRTFPMNFYQRDANDILAFMDALDIKQAHILGYSDGGEAALIAAGTAPERFATVAVIGAVGYFGQAVRVRVMGFRPGSEWITAEEIAMHHIDDADAFMRGWSRAVLQMVDSGGDIALSLAPNMTAPLLVMLGENDALNPREYAAKLVAQAGAGGRVVMFACGHPVHEEQPQRFREVYAAHLNTV